MEFWSLNSAIVAMLVEVALPRIPFYSGELFWSMCPRLPRTNVLRPPSLIGILLQRRGQHGASGRSHHCQGGHTKVGGHLVDLYYPPPPRPMCGSRSSHFDRNPMRGGQNEASGRRPHFHRGPNEVGSHLVICSPPHTIYAGWRQPLPT